MKKIIGIVGKMRSGKDTLCALLGCSFAPEPTHRLAFADELKKEVADLLGVSVEFIEENKKLFRPLLQWWGTEWRRNLFGEDYWIKKIDPKINSINDGVIVVADVRFDNEAEYVRSLGGEIVLIQRAHERPEYHDQLAESPHLHSSEELADRVDADHIVVNNGSLEDLEQTASRLAKILREHQQVEKVCGLL